MSEKSDMKQEGITFIRLSLSKLTKLIYAGIIIINKIARSAKN